MTKTTDTKTTPTPAVTKPAIFTAKPRSATRIAAAQKFGRVDDDKVILLPDETLVGQYRGTGIEIDPQMALYVDRYLDLVDEFDLFEFRLTNEVPNLKPQGIIDTIADLKKQLSVKRGVGDYAVLEARLPGIEKLADARREAIRSEKTEEAQAALHDMVALIRTLNEIVITEPSKILWKDASVKLDEAQTKWSEIRKEIGHYGTEKHDEAWKKFSELKNQAFDMRAAWRKERGEKVDAALKPRAEILAKAKAAVGDTALFDTLIAIEKPAEGALEIPAELETQLAAKPWVEVAKKLAALQGDWKKTPNAKSKELDKIWKQFKDLTDKFFAAKNKYEELHPELKQDKSASKSGNKGRDEKDGGFGGREKGPRNFKEGSIAGSLSDSLDGELLSQLEAFKKNL